MRKPRNFDAELKALQNKQKTLRATLLGALLELGRVDVSGPGAKCAEFDENQEAGCGRCLEVAKLWKAL